MKALTADVLLAPLLRVSINEHSSCKLSPSHLQISTIASQLACSRRRLVLRPLMVTFLLINFALMLL